MDEMKGIHIIQALRRKWIWYSMLSDGLISAGIAFLPAVLLHIFFGWPAWWGNLYFFVVFVFLLLMHSAWKVKEKALAQSLDETYPQLEESSELLLRSPAELNMLERLQYKKISHALSLIAEPLSISKKIKMPVFVLALVLVTGVVLYRFPFHFRNNAQAGVQVILNGTTKPETLLPQIAHVSVSINPPAYTARPARQQQAFNLIAEEGAVVDWQLQTTVAAGQVKFIFNDSVEVVLHSTGAAHTQWRTGRKIDSSGFYQVHIDGKLSELYKIETVPDKLPVVLIQTPKQYTTIEYGESTQVRVTTTVSDDYRIQEAFIAATIASGNGEAVKFTEQKIALNGFVAGKSQYQLQQLLSLTAMGMQPGDELYFYVQATDNHRQQTRSDIHIVHLPDTAQLMSLEGIANSLTLKPEYFRSQRQIIIETEQLLKDRDTISEETFKNRSNNLGIDQKLLRLRYGKFLGDEDESGETGTGPEDIANFSNEDSVRDAFTDKHDNAEDASFYEPETKKQLRATLTEMWNAEIQLRTFKSKDALPFEYKALRLLKDLQQKSRAYVAKTNFKTTPLDLKKRLTADLSKINQPVLQKDIPPQADPQLPVRHALALLEQIKLMNDGNNISIGILQQASLRLHEKAIQQPGLYLNAVVAMKRITGALNMAEKADPADILAAQHGLQQMIAAPDRLPSAAKHGSAQTLSKQYFNNLQKRQP